MGALIWFARGGWSDWRIILPSSGAWDSLAGRAAGAGYLAVRYRFRRDSRRTTVPGIAG